MTAKYLIRMDDACPTMDHDKWEYLEKILDEFSIKPIVAVVPKNVDDYLNCKESDPLFWEKVISWQTKGWSIAMHGYEHDMHFTDADLILPFYKRSEFAGLSYDKQAKKIRQGYKIFRDLNVNPEIWIAPSHCFDKITLQAIFNETSIRVVSDGIALNQYFEDSFYWIPQQLWSFKLKKHGLWTVCLHPNEMTIDDLESFRNTLTKFSTKIISYKDIILTKRKKNIFDIFYSFYFWRKYKLFNLIYKIRSSIKNYG